MTVFIILPRRCKTVEIVRRCKQCYNMAGPKMCGDAQHIWVGVIITDDMIITVNMTAGGARPVCNDRSQAQAGGASAVRAAPTRGKGERG